MSKFNQLTGKQAIEFIKERQKEIKSTGREESGEAVASMYRSIISEPSLQRKRKRVISSLNGNQKVPTKFKIKESFIEEVEEIFTCVDCKLTMQHSKKIHHLSSLSHQLSSTEEQKNIPIFYPVNATNNLGYNLLQKEGWVHGTGLGPDAEGRKLPIAITFKNDKKGLGVKGTSKKKITHTSEDIYNANLKPRQLTFQQTIDLQQREEYHRRSILEYLNRS